jgi:hypothetical protein
MKTGKLQAVAREHLIAKKRSGKFSDEWLAMAELHLTRAVDFFGSERDLTGIAPSDVQAWITAPQKLPNGRKDVLRREASDST